MRFRLLGPVGVVVGERSVVLGPPQRQAILAALLVDCGRVVPAEVLIKRVWGDAPPPGARAALHSHISRLRNVLLDASGGADSAPVELCRLAGGYVLRTEPDYIDINHFKQLLDQARDGSRSLGQRVAAARQSLGLWHGEPLAGVRGEWAEQVRSNLLHQHATGLARWGELELDLGHCDEVIERMSIAILSDPLNEVLAAVLIRALSLAGRAADALRAYATVRTRLADELGVDPGPDLRATFQALLSGELSPHRSSVARARSAPPAQLPADVPGFTGRRAEKARLDAILAATEQPNAVVIAAVSGTAGVGKTALAVHWAHLVRERYPDGQLYVNLRGYDPDQPMSAADALARFLGALGVTGPDIPQETDERAARYRSEVAGRRILIVLDNASSVEQVRPLLPGAASCAVVVTSRDSLAGLVAAHGADRLELDRLPAAEAITLLRHLIGPRADAEPGAVATMANHCARLPLAVRVAAELAVSRPSTTLAALASELTDQQQRLRLLGGGGDPRSAVTAVFSWSIQHLPPDAAGIFRLLGLHPGADIDAYGAAALAGTAVVNARDSLEQLARAHLVDRLGPGRYGMHDLLRAYAAGLATTADSDGARRRALSRLFDYYLGTASAAMDRLFPAEAHRRPRIAAPTSPAPELADPGAARAWLDIERSTLVAVAAHATAHGWPDHVVRLSATLFRYLDSGHYSDALALYAYAHQAGENTNDRGGQAQALIGLGAAHYQLGRYALAAEHLQRALDLYRQTGDRTGEARALNNLGILEMQLCRYQTAADHLRQAMALYRHSGERIGEARTLDNLGLIEQEFARYRSGADYHRHALALFRQAGDQVGESRALDNLGCAEERLGRCGPALEHLQRALILVRRLGDRRGEARVLESLGTVYTSLGQLDPATEHFAWALSLSRDAGDPYGEGRGLNGLGRVAQANGDPAAAIAHFSAALSLLTNTGARGQQAHSHAGLGQAYQHCGDLSRARQHYEHALVLYRDLGVPGADVVRAHLAALPQPTTPTGAALTAPSAADPGPAGG